MCCRIVELKNKEVICIKDATRIGLVNDVEIDTCSGKVVSLVIYGKPRLFGLLGREEDIVINWDCIEVIGDDTILVSYNAAYKPLLKKNRFSDII
ncbi:MAG: YlmC/YmxH family sporulation protein [Clostridia bacterium]|nr:YlmC/YmxH family sporulation protein [Clostridia bacterium]